MTLEELVVKITGETSGLKNAMSSAVSAVGKFSAAAVAAGATAAAAITKSAVESYADYEQLVGGVETLFKDSAGIVQEYAANAFQTAGLSANDYKMCIRDRNLYVLFLDLQMVIILGVMYRLYLLEIYHKISQIPHKLSIN